jgi:BlaI family transcriptional regulator, penicillinase repressor
MAKPIPPRPTDGELAILKVLWEHGPCTVRQVQEALARLKPTGYTTALKLLQVMAEKGLVLRDESQRSHVYRAHSSEEQTQSQLVGDLIRRAFGGSARKLVMQALASEPATADELAEIRRLLDRLQHDQGGDS